MRSKTTQRTVPPLTSADTDQPAVTLALPRLGANAISVVHRLKKIEAPKGRTIPNDVERHHAELRRDGGGNQMNCCRMASRWLASRLTCWRQLARVCHCGHRHPPRWPSRWFSLRLHSPHYTLCLEFSIGILVDDAIGGRKYRAVFSSPQNKKAALAGHRGRGGERSREPTILATFVVIAAVLRWVCGRTYGTYMRPIPVRSGAAMFFPGDCLHRDAPLHSHPALRKKYSRPRERGCRGQRSFPF